MVKLNRPLWSSVGKPQLDRYIYWRIRTDMSIKYYEDMVAHAIKEETMFVKKRSVEIGSSFDSFVYSCHPFYYVAGRG